MATSKKGGHIILDFKDEPLIGTNTQLVSRDWYSAIVNSRGKEIRLINYGDMAEDIERGYVVTVSIVIFRDENVTLRISSIGDLQISRDNKANWVEY